ncbi:hypothetical protein PROFUN_01102 [Planoprotostelium fungivorum]|uniref:Uncharacterized protein n=1 Tax=Planoprotostelium fungivorum TaxID=1890364 RepID=A0A2P6NCC6_9EUKA|nr:hypothetical protein PROFUN_01102 [Planoprotostelium fungivorum]
MAEIKEGVMLGNTSVEYRQYTTDQSETVVKESTDTSVYTFQITSKSKNCFPKSNEQIISHMNSNENHQVVGWFHYMKDRKTLRPTMRELTHHKTTMSQRGDVPINLFAIFSHSDGSEDDLKTLDFSYRFQTMINHTFQPVDVQIAFCPPSPLHSLGSPFMRGVEVKRPPSVPQRVVDDLKASCSEIIRETREMTEEYSKLNCAEKKKLLDE